MGTPYERSTMSDRPSAVSIRPLTATDGPTCRGLFTAAFGNTLYAEAPRGALHAALDGAAAGRDNPEAAGLVAMAGDRLVGVAVYGEVAGAIGAGKMHGMAVAPDSQRLGIARTLIEAFAADLARRGSRFVLVEFPDAPELAAGRTLLLQCKFVEESRLPDFFVDGVALSFLRRNL
jgi:ribosomal protein S18 acetylase RimI-like enzyme